MYLKTIEVQGFKSFANKIVFEFHNGITGIVGPNGSGKSNVADAVRWVLGEQKVKQLRSSSMQDVIFSGTETRKPQGFAYVAITLDNSDHKLAIDFDQVTVSRRIYRSGESEYLLNGSPCRLKDINELFYDTGIGKEGYSIIGQGQIDKILSGRPEERRELFDEAAGIVKFKRRKAIAQKKLEDEKQNLVRVSDILGELEKQVERRELFDEAAGIVKFKRRKAIAQKKLEDEKQNLVRVSDILGELEKQVGPLEKQAASAREYLRLREEMKRFDVNLFLTEMEDTDRALRELEEKSRIVSGHMEESRQESEQLKEEYDRVAESIAALDQIITEKQALGNEARMNARNLEGRISVLNEQIRAERMNAEHIRSRIASIESELQEKERDRGRHQEEKQQLKVQVQAMEKRLREGEDQLEQASSRVSGLERSIEDGKAALIGALNERSGLSVKKQRYDTLLEQVQVRRSEVAQKLLKVKTDEEAWDGQIQEQEKALASVNQAIETLVTEGEILEGEAKEAAGQIAKTDEEAWDGQIQEQEKALASVNQAIETLVTEGEILEGEAKEAAGQIACLNKNLNNAQQEYHTSYTRLESLRNLAERYDGYGNSIRRVMECRDRVRGIHGVVADLLDVPKEYETAIETALGGSIQNVVTDSEETAKIMIGHLKKNRYGRATFLPLTAVSSRGGFPEPQALKEPGAIGVAADLVKTREEYKGLVQYLLGRVLVVDHMDHAISIARKYRHSIRMVTPEGDLLSPGGSMSGGAFKNSSNLLGRRREMEEMEEACKKALLTVDRIQKELVFQESLLEEKNSSLSSVRASLQARYLEQNTAKLSLRQLNQKKEELTESSADMNLENRQLEEQMREIRRNIAGLLASMEELEAENTARNEAITSDGVLLEAARNQREEASRALSQIQLEAAGLKQQDLEAENTARNEAITSDGVLLEAARNQREEASRALSQIQLEAAGLKQQDSFLDQNLSRLEEETGRLLAEQTRSSWRPLV